jgi:hypothetical protein
MSDMKDPTITCYTCREQVAPRVIAPAMPGFSDYETRDYWCERCGPIGYWTVKIGPKRKQKP